MWFWIAVGAVVSVPVAAAWRLDRRRRTRVNEFPVDEQLMSAEWYTTVLYPRYRRGGHAL